MSILIPRLESILKSVKSHASKCWSSKVKRRKECWENVKSRNNTTKYSRGHRRKKLLLPVKRFDFWKSSVAGGWLSSPELSRVIRCTSKPEMRFRELCPTPPETGGVGHS